MSERPYHHGDLTQALVSNGLDAARSGGPSAITVRELAKAAGVSPTATYRHFGSLEHLVAAVAQQARELMATQMLTAMDAVEIVEPSDRAWARLDACGRAYVLFALAEPGWFATAFHPCQVMPARPDSPDAWTLLSQTLDQLNALGELHPALADSATTVAWSAVHGLSGILASAPPCSMDADASLRGVLDGVQRGLRAERRADRAERRD